MSKLEKVNHPYVSVLVAACSVVASVGGGSAFWQYLSDRETTRLESQLQSKEVAIKLHDLEAQIAAGVILLAEQGKQIKALKGALENLARGQKSTARRAVSEMEIPMEQGQPILRGRLVDKPEAIEEKAMKLRSEYQELESMMKQHKR